MIPGGRACAAASAEMASEAKEHEKLVLDAVVGFGGAQQRARGRGPAAAVGGG